MKMYTLKKFVTLFNDDSKITSIFLDSNNLLKDSLFDESSDPLDKLKDLNNLLEQPEFIDVNLDGDYFLNKQNCFKTYGDYIVTLCLPVLQSSSRFNENIDEDSDEYVTTLADIVSECKLIIQEVEYDDGMVDLLCNYKPTVSSTISCYVICNVLPSDDEHGCYTFRDIIGCVSTFDDAIAVAKKRLNFMTAIHEIKNGAVSKTTIYFTDSSGLVGKRADV